MNDNKNDTKEGGATDGLWLRALALPMLTQGFAGSIVMYWVTQVGFMSQASINSCVLFIEPLRRWSNQTLGWGQFYVSSGAWQTFGQFGAGAIRARLKRCKHGKQMRMGVIMNGLVWLLWFFGLQRVFKLSLSYMESYRDETRKSINSLGQCTQFNASVI